MAAAPPDPIEVRLDQLRDQWQSFVENPQARLLRWVFRGEEVGCLEAFLEAENHEETGKLPDVFVRLSVSFEGLQSGSGVKGYGAALLEAFRKQVDASLTALELPSLELPHIPAPAAGGRASRPELGTHEELDAFIRAAQRFAEHTQLPRFLVFVLVPTTVSSADDFATFTALVACRSEPQLRFVVVDPQDSPRLAQLADALPEPARERVVSCEANLDMAAALIALSQNADGQATPGGAFRQLSVQLMAACSNDAPNMTEVERLAQRALEVARAAGQPDWQAVTCFMLAGAYTAAGDLNRALSLYQRAAEHNEQAAGLNAAPQTPARSLELEDPDADPPTTLAAPNATDSERFLQLALKARLSEGSVQVACRDYRVAAQAFERARSHAETLSDGPAIIDCHRLVSFCHEQLGDTEAAWHHGWLGITAAQSMEAHDRETSTLPFLGEALLRIAASCGARDGARKVDRALTDLVNTEWRKPVLDAAAAAARMEAE